MFDELRRKLKKLEQGTSIPVDFPTDDDGYIDRQCPSTECRQLFKVLHSDWRNKVPNEQAFCAFCRHEERGDGEWQTDDQKDFLERVALRHVDAVITDAMRTDARRHNALQRRRPKGFINLSIMMSVKPGPHSVLVPMRAAEVLRQRFTCESCRCNYASLGASFFCHACGHNSVTTTFDNTLATVRRIVHALPKLRKTLTDAVDADTAQDSARQLLEDQFARVVGAFEKLSHALFVTLPTASQHTWSGNIFQRVNDCSTLWRNATGSGYDAFLLTAELSELKLRFQQRHVLGHGQGLVDQQYIDRSGDTRYAVGQRLVIRDSDVVALVDLASKLAIGLRTLVP